MKRVERSLPESITLVSTTCKEFPLSTQLAQEKSRVLADLIQDETDGEYRIPLPSEDGGVNLLVKYLTDGRRMRLMLYPETDGLAFIFLIHYLDIYFPMTEHYLRWILFANREKFVGYNGQNRMYLCDSIHIFPPPTEGVLPDKFAQVKPLLVSIVFPRESIHMLMHYSTVSMYMYNCVFNYLLLERVPASLVCSDPTQRVLAYILTQVYLPSEAFHTRREAMNFIEGIEVKTPPYRKIDCILAAAASNCLPLDRTWRFKVYQAPSDLIRQSLSELYAWANALKPISLKDCIDYVHAAREYSQQITKAKANKDFNFLYSVYPVNQFKALVNLLTAPPDKE